MYLVITSNDSYFLNNNEDLVLLGKWCLNNKDLKNKKIEYVFDYNWINFNENIKDQKYLYSLYKKIVSKISKKLNIYHKKNYNEKYWEYLLGHWLWLYVINLYDRYLYVRKVKDKFPHINLTVNSNKYYYTKSDEFWKLLHDDEYNNYLFSNIILNTKNKFNKRIINKEFKKIEKIKIKKIKNFKYFLNYILQQLRLIKNIFFEKYGSNFNYFIDLNSPLSFTEKKEIYKKLNQVFFTPNVLLINFKKIFSFKDINKLININNRNQNLGLEYKNEFELLINKTILGDLPLEYMELYDKIRAKISKYLPKKIPKIVLVRSQTETNTNLRFLISELVINKSKIISFQEGGGVGSKVASEYSEKIYNRLSDVWLNWGWKSENPKIKKFFFTKNFWINNYNYKKNGNLLIVGSSCRRHFIDFHNGQLPYYNEIQMKLNKELISKLDKNIFNKLIYRLHFKFGYDEDKKLKKSFKNIKLSFREDKSHYYTLLNDSKLVLCTSDFTNFKQTFVVNHPTILLWDKNFFRFRKSAKIYYDLLEKNQILFNDPSKCADFINKIYDDPLKWWLTKEVQEARNLFMNEFCNKSQNLAKEFVNIIS